MSEWYFRDKTNKVQGPFASEEMRAWYEAGYLPAELMVAKGDPRSNPFKPMAQHFPNGSSAFLEGVSSPASAGQWYFLDKNHVQQGPFNDFQMRQWHMAGYFEGTLMIIDTNQEGAAWGQLREYFPYLAEAFAGSEYSAPAPRNENKNGGKKENSTTGNQKEDPRLNFPDWLPVPPRFRGVKKVYPSEKNGKRKM